VLEQLSELLLVIHSHELTRGLSARLLRRVTSSNVRLNHERRVPTGRNQAKDRASDCSDAK
jgi:hypothetical protein